MLLDIVAMVGVLRQLHRVLALEYLQIPYLQRQTEFFNLVAGVVDVKFPPHRVSGGIQHAGETIPQRAAPGVAHMHGTGGVGGNIFHHHLFAAAEIGAAELLVLPAHLRDHIAVIGRGEKEIHKSGTGDLRFVKIGAAQLQMGGQRIGNLPGGGVKCPGGDHGGVDRHIAVFPVGGDLHRVGRDVRLGQLAGGDGCSESVPDQLPQLGFRLFYDIGHDVFSSCTVICTVWDELMLPLNPSV